MIDIDAEHFAIGHDLATGHKNGPDMRRIGPRKQIIKRIDRHQRIAIQPVQVKHNQIRRLARFQGSVADNAIGITPRRDRFAEIIGARNDLVISPAAMKKMAEAQFAQGIIILVERGSVDSGCDMSATLESFGYRSNSGAKVQIGTGVGDDGGARARNQVEFIGARVNAMRQRQPRRKQADVFQKRQNARRAPEVGVGALVFCLEKVHMHSSAVARRGFCNTAQQRIRAPLNTGQPILNCK